MGVGTWESSAIIKKKKRKKRLHHQKSKKYEKLKLQRFEEQITNKIKQTGFILTIFWSFYNSVKY